jgi:hypothetical protein
MTKQRQNSHDVSNWIVQKKSESMLPSNQLDTFRVCTATMTKVFSPTLFKSVISSFVASKRLKVNTSYLALGRAPSLSLKLLDQTPSS